MRVVAYVREPLSNAGSRCRIAALAPGLAARGIGLRVFPPMSARLASWCRAGGRGRRLLYHLLLLLNRLRQIPSAARADAVIVFRGIVPLGPPWMERLVRLLNRNLVYDFDDALWLRPPFATAGYRFVDLRAPERILRHSRAAAVGSPWLEEYARRWCADVRVIPSCIDMERFCPGPRTSGAPVVIGWTGSQSGFLYLHALDGIWRELQARHGVVLRVVSDGVYEAEGVQVDNVRWSAEGEVEALRSFDIGVMPLLDTPFERGKAGFKLIQCMAVGAASVASPVGVNRELCGEDESRGLLAATPAEWLAKLEALVTDAGRRQRLGEAARAWVCARYDISCAVDAWACLLHDLTGPALR